MYIYIYVYIYIRSSTSFPTRRGRAKERSNFFIICLFTLPAHRQSEGAIFFIFINFVIFFFRYPLPGSRQSEGARQDSE